MATIRINFDPSDINNIPVVGNADAFVQNRINQSNQEVWLDNIRQDSNRYSTSLENQSNLTPYGYDLETKRKIDEELARRAKLRREEYEKNFASDVAGSGIGSAGNTFSLENATDYEKWLYSQSKNKPF